MSKSPIISFYMRSITWKLYQMEKSKIVSLLSIKKMLENTKSVQKKTKLPISLKLYQQTTTAKNKESTSNQWKVATMLQTF